MSAETHVFIVAFSGWIESIVDAEHVRWMKLEADVEVERFEISAALWGIPSRQHSRLESISSTSHPPPNFISNDT